MTIDPNPTLTFEEFRRALPIARSLFDPKWLLRNQRKRPHDSVLLTPEKAMRTRRQNLHAVAHDYPDDGMHPLAEAIAVADAAIADYERGQASVMSPTFYRILTLRDIANSRNKIQGVDKRIARLRSPDWKSTLHELIIATSYLPALTPSFVDENNSPTPDFILPTKPLTSVECKVRINYERKIIDFIKRWRKNSLQKITTSLQRYPDSYIVRIRVSGEASNLDILNLIPREIDRMARIEMSHLEAENYEISLEKMDGGLRRFDKPVPYMKQNFWNLAFGFNEWEEWHYVFPHGEINVSDADQRFATGVGKCSIICVRDEGLKDNRISLVSTIKGACRRQFSRHENGIVFVLLNANLFGLGQLQDINSIKRILSIEIDKIFQDYSRVFKIVIDIAYHDHGHYEQIGTNRLIGLNPKAKAPLGYIDPKPIIMV